MGDARIEKDDVDVVVGLATPTSEATEAKQAVTLASAPTEPAETVVELKKAAESMHLSRRESLKSN